MRKFCSLSSVIVLGIATIFFGPSGPLNRSNAQEKPTYQTTSSEGKLTGKISFEGQAPEPKRIDTGSDPVCAENNLKLFTEDVVVTRGKLANVLVYLRSGGPLEWYVFDAPTAEVTLSHRFCQFVPHMLGMQIQQTLSIATGDTTYHNIHFIPRENADWNQTQPPNSDPLKHRFTTAELGIPAKDNQHPWEKAYVSVFTHPFFSVSAIDGSFEIRGVPPGQYTVVAWHERFGEQTAEISIGVREQKTLDFTFNPTEK
jgi:hypothetical protein